MELDIVFNIDYPSEFEIGPLYVDVPKYIEYIEIKNIDQLKRLVKRLKDDVDCYIWLHPSFSSVQVIKGIESKITTESEPDLKALGIEFTQITRSTGKTSNSNYYDVGKMLDIKKTKKSYKAFELKAILYPIKSSEAITQIRPRVEESIREDIQAINKDFILRKEFLKTVYADVNTWYENLFELDIQVINEIFGYPYWDFKNQIITTFLNVEDLGANVIREEIVSLPETIKFDDKEKIWMIDFSFFDEVSKRFESQSQTDYRTKLKIASSIYVLHETIHKQHNLDNNTVTGIGNFPRIIEEADYQADSIAILIDLAYYIYSNGGLTSVSGDQIIEKICEIIQIAIETTFSFNPISTELKQIQVRRVNRYLIWLVHYLKLREYRGKNLSNTDLLVHILKQFATKPFIEISGPAIKSNFEQNRTFYDLNKIVHPEEIAVLKIDNEIVRMGPIQSVDFGKFYDAIKQSNFTKLVEFLKILFDNNKAAFK